MSQLDVSYLLKIMYILPHLFITISLLLLPLIYHNFTPTLSESASTFLLLALIYDIFTTRSIEHGSDFVMSTYYSDRLSREFTEELKVFKNVFLLDETSRSNVVKCLKIQACEPVCEEIHIQMEDVHKFIEAEEEEPKVRTELGFEDKKINEFGKTSVTSYVKSHGDFVENNRTNGRDYNTNLGQYGCTGEEEEWKSTLAWKLFEERHYNVVEGDEGMDSLWEAFEADSIKSRIIDVVVKKKDIKKKSGELDKKCGNEDEDGVEVEMRNGCLQGFKCCSVGTGGKMNMGMRRGGNSIVKISKPFKMISWWRHLKRHAKRKRF